MTLSLNEVEATAKKAARGAGYPWGLAEEAGRAVRCLCAHDLDGCAALARLLAQTDGADLSGWTPQTGDGDWTAASGTLCPLITGAALSDRAGLLSQGGIGLDWTAEPLLLVPFALLCARRLGVVVAVAWGTSKATTDGTGIAIAGLLAGPACDRVGIWAGGGHQRAMRRRYRADPSPEVHAALDRLAHRTYAPATEASRLRGAGAGLSDND